MKTTLSLIAILGLLALIGCIPLSLNPFYFEKDLQFDPALVGLWADKDEAPQIRFEKTGTNGYLMTDFETDSTLKFDARLFKIGDKLFMDLSPKSNGVVKNDLLDMHLIRGHSLMRVDRISPSFVVAGFDLNWLTNLLSDNPKALPHVATNDRLILTATTAELQAFVLKYVNDTAAFEQPTEMFRVTGQ